MYLHENRELFETIIEAASIQQNMPVSVIEKDYYVTTILKLLANKSDKCVFKGGTSLSKGYHVLNRFSEDIDIAFTEHIGEKKRKKLKYNVLQSISEELHIPISNWEEIQSDRDYNCYVFSYKPLYNDISGSLFPGVKLETALSSNAFPIEVKEIDSYIRQFLEKENDELIDTYGLQTFPMQVQSLERTYIDKMFAVCDYFIQGKDKRYSRHLYDIYKLMPHVTFDESLKALIAEVRLHRAQMRNCPSARPEVDVSGLLYEIYQSEFFKKDFDEITRYFILDNVKYEEAAEVLIKIADSRYF